MRCKFCKKELVLNQWELNQKSITIKRKYCNRHCAQKGKSINPITTRYRVLKIKGKKISEHRYVMEQFLKRKLLPTEYVHHIDKDKLNNQISNLKIVTCKSHGEEHRKYTIEKKCVICGDVYIPHKTKRKRQQTCSKKCMCKLLSLREEEKRISKLAENT